MRITLLFNPIAGGGRAARCAEQFAERLGRAGHSCTTLPTRPGGDHTWLDRALESVPAGASGPRDGDASAPCELLVVIGGDGAVRLASAPAARHGVPIWQVPLGTENLFAREWGMDREVETLLGAIDRRDETAIDLGMVAAGAGAGIDALDGGIGDQPGDQPGDQAGDQSGDRCAVPAFEPFVLMASIGFDSRVVHALAGARRGGISHWSYAAPIVRTLVSHVAPMLRIDVDGCRVDRGGRGFVIVANSSQYAMRLDPVKAARLNDGLLDLLWFPGDGVLALLGWLARCAAGVHGRSERLGCAQGRRVTIESDEPFLYQLDGDPPWATGVGVGVKRLEIGVKKGALRVLRPAQASVAAR